MKKMMLMVLMFAVPATVKAGDWIGEVRPVKAEKAAPVKAEKLRSLLEEFYQTAGFQAALMDMRANASGSMRPVTLVSQETLRELTGR
jgi:hypothetical protein